jgi:hypothetical protein
MKEHTELIRKFVLRSFWLGNRRGSCWRISLEWKNFSTTTAGSSIAGIAYEFMPLPLRIIASSIKSHVLIKSSVSTTPSTVRLTRTRFMHSPMDTCWWGVNFRTDYWENKTEITPVITVPHPGGIVIAIVLLTMGEWDVGRATERGLGLHSCKSTISYPGHGKTTAHTSPSTVPAVSVCLNLHQLELFPLSRASWTYWKEHLWQKARWKGGTIPTAVPSLALGRLQKSPICLGE